jgi:uncharacterized membrane protein
MKKHSLHEFLSHFDHQRVSQAIVQAEETTTGEIRVRVSHRGVFLFQDEVQFSRRAFVEMGMTETPDRNAVLIVVFPKRHKLVVIGDDAIHRRVGEKGWVHVIQAATGYFKAGDFTQGILQGVKMIGVMLTKHFPKTPNDTNSLDNRIVED